MTAKNISPAERSKRPRKLNVFLCYTAADQEQVFKLAGELKTHNIDSWLEDEKILPGQNRKQEIRRALSSMDGVIVFLSKAAISKSEFIESEFQLVQEFVASRPQGSMFLIPARFDECNIPKRLDGLRWVDLYRIGGDQQLLTSLQEWARQLGIGERKQQDFLSRYFGRIPRWLRTVGGILVTVFTVLAAIVSFGADTLSILNQLYQNLSGAPQPTIVINTPTTLEQKQYMSVYTDAATTWPVEFQDDFSSDKGVWFNGDFSDNAWKVKKHIIVDGKYRTVATPVFDSKGWMPANTIAPVSEFYLAVDAQLVNGSAFFNEYGLIFGYKNGQDFLSFVIGDDGEFRFSTHNSDYTITNVIDWTKTDAIIPRRVNRLTVISQDMEFLFFINGQFVGRAHQERDALGKVGLIILSSNSDETVIFEFDNFELRTPQEITK